MSKTMNETTYYLATVGESEENIDTMYLIKAKSRCEAEEKLNECNNMMDSYKYVTLVKLPKSIMLSQLYNIIPKGYFAGDILSINP